MLDTNVPISAVYNPSSTTFQAFRKASEPPYVLVLCDQVIDELRRIFNRKFPTKIQAMERFLSIAHYDLVTLTSLKPAPLRHLHRSLRHPKAPT